VEDLIIKNININEKTKAFNIEHFGIDKLKTYNVEFNAQVLYDIYIKQQLDSPFIENETNNPPFTLFKFKNFINKSKLNQLSYLISYGYLYEKKKKNAFSDMSVKKLQDSFYSYYK
jgi:hypothetical protein